MSRLSPLLLLPLLLGGCLERTEPTAEQAVRPVHAARVAAAPEAQPRHFPGIVRPRREADLGFRAGGRIAERLVDLGSRVAAGQALARLDDADLALAVRAAEADLAGAEAQAAMTAAEAARSRTLAAQGWASAALDDQRQAAARTAAQRAEAARAALALARSRQGHALLRAPADGIVTAILADRGTVVAEGQPALRLAETAALEIEVQLPETALAAARAPATATLWAQPGRALPVRLREVAAAAAPGLRTYAARYTLDGPAEGIALGMSATLALAGTLPEGLAALPASALADRGQGPIVWVIDGHRIAARKVAIAGRSGERALVTGVAPGELVVALGVHKLDPASEVRIAVLAQE